MGTTCQEERHRDRGHRQQAGAKAAHHRALSRLGVMLIHLRRKPRVQNRHQATCENMDYPSRWTTHHVLRLTCMIVVNDVACGCSVSQEGPVNLGGARQIIARWKGENYRDGVVVGRVVLPPRFRVRDKGRRSDGASSISTRPQRKDCCRSQTFRPIQFASVIKNEISAPR